jgi:hypothetical protein
MGSDLDPVHRDDGFSHGRRKDSGTQEGLVFSRDAERWLVVGGAEDDGERRKEGQGSKHAPAPRAHGRSIPGLVCRPWGRSATRSSVDLVHVHEGTEAGGGE